MAAKDSVLRTYFVEVAHSDELSNLRLLLISLSEDKIGIVSSNKLIITQGFLGKRSSLDWETPSQTTVEFDEEYGRASALKWLSSDVICVGFENGCIACFLFDGTFIFEYSGHNSQVQSLRVSNKELYPGMGTGLWILYEEGVMMMIPLKNIFNSGDDGIGKFKFVENCQLNDFVFLPNNLLRGSRQADVSHCMLLGGFSPSISLHHIGGKLQFQTFSRLAREKVGTAISKTLSSFFGNNISNPSPPPDKSRMADVVEEISLVSSFDFEDPKRRIIRMSIDPRGKLVAAADSLGRVTLFDTRTQGIVRIWKGVRDARLAWSEGGNSNSGSGTAVGCAHSSCGGVTLCLAIYAPQVGLLSIYAMRHGGCLRTIPVGPQAHIFTIFEKNSVGERLAKCGLLRLEPRASAEVPSDMATGVSGLLDSLTLTVLSPFGASPFDSNGVENIALGLSDSELLSQQRQRRQESPKFKQEPGSFAVKSGATSNRLKAVEDSLLDIAENAFSNREPGREATVLVNPEAEESLLRTLQKFEDCSDMLLSLDMIDCIERVGSLQVVFSETSPSASVRDFLSRLETCRHQHFGNVSAQLESQSQVPENVSLASSPASESMLLMSAFRSSHPSAKSLISGMGIAYQTGPLIPCVIEFSVEFHEAASLHLLKLALNEQDNEAQKSRSEAIRRLLVSDSFRLLKNQCSELAHSMLTGSGVGVDPNSLRPDVDLLDTVHLECRKNSIKAEALCWALRVRRVSQASAVASVSGGDSVPPVLCPLPSAVTNKRVHKAIVSQISPPPGPRYNSAAQSTSSTTSSRKSGSGVGEFLGRQSMGSSYDMWDSGPQEACLTFGMFLGVTDVTGSVRSQALLIALDALQEGCDLDLERCPPLTRLVSGDYRVSTLRYMHEDMLGIVGDESYRNMRWEQCSQSLLPSALHHQSDLPLVGSSVVTLSFDSACGIPTMCVINSTGTVAAVQSLLWASSSFDLFSVRSFSQALSSLQLEGTWRLPQSLPLLLLYFERLPFTKLAPFLTSVSPLQRWLRDNLLAFESELQPLISDSKAAAEFIEHPSTSIPKLNSIEESEEWLKSIQDMRNISNQRSWLQKCYRYYSALRQRVKNDESGDVDRELSYDEAVGFALRSAYVFVEQSQNLEAAMVFTTFLLETLQLVADQIERRSSGRVHLRQTLADWNLLRRQLRTTLFLSCRCGMRQMHLKQQLNQPTTAKSVSPLVTLPLTVHALDSGLLSVYAILAADTLCFASRADHAVEHEHRCLQVYSRRSNEVPQAQSGSASSSSKAILAWGGSAERRWRELIQVTESEDQVDDADSSGSIPAYSSSTSASSSHGRKSEAEPGSGSKKIRRRRPLLLFFPQHNDSDKLGVYRSLTLLQKWMRRPSKMELLTLCIDHLNGIGALYRASLACHLLHKSFLPLLRLLFVLENNPSERPSVSAQHKDCLSALVNPANLQQFLKIITDLIGLREPESSSATDVGVGESGLKLGGEEEPSWPPVKDTLVEHMINVLPTARTGLDRFLPVAWVLYLRSLCGLRGVKPCELFCRDDFDGLEIDLLGQLPADLLARMALHPATPPPAISHGSGNTSHPHSNDLWSNRCEFLLQVLRRPELECSGIAYKLGEAWAMDSRHVRITHLTALLDHGGMDDQAEELMAAVGDPGAVVDCVVESLRVRVGVTIARIEKIPAFSRVLSVMDSSAVAWVRSFIGAPDSNIVEMISRGKMSPIGFNLASTRHLVIRMHSLLLADSKQQKEPAWVLRREKCDALLLMCNILSQLQTKA